MTRTEGRSSGTLLGIKEWNWFVFKNALGSFVVDSWYKLGSSGFSHSNAPFLARSSGG